MKIAFELSLEIFWSRIRPDDLLGRGHRQSDVIHEENGLLGWPKSEARSRGEG